MRFDSIRMSHKLVIFFFITISSVVFVNYYLNRILRTADTSYRCVLRCGKLFGALLLEERDALADPLRLSELEKAYDRVERRWVDSSIGLNTRDLRHRRILTNELFRLEEEFRRLNHHSHQNLLELIRSVRYIHNHHFSYLENLLGRGLVSQDYDSKENFERSPFKSAGELTILKAAASVQEGLLSISESFHALENESTAENSIDFPERIKRFFASINRFEDYSLDAQDGILVEELIVVGRSFEESFKALQRIQDRRKILNVKLQENRSAINRMIADAAANLLATNTGLKRKITYIQMVTYILTVLLLFWIVRIGRRRIKEINRTIVETEKIQTDITHRITIDDSVAEEYKTVFKTLNSMGRTIDAQIQELEEANEYLELRVLERTAELSNLNKSLKQEIDEKETAERALMASQKELELRVEERTAQLAEANHLLEVELSERVHVEKNLRESENRFRALFELAPDACYLNDTDGRFLDANKAAEDLFGYKKSELWGKTLSDLNLIPQGKSPAKLHSLTTGSYGGDSHPDEVIITDRTGRQVVVETRCLPARIRGQDVVLGSARDVSQRKTLERRLRQAQKMKAIGTLAGGVAHDLNNVLSGVVGYPDLLLMGLPDNSPLKEPLLTIKKSGERASMIVQDLLTLARRGVSVSKPVDLNHIVSEYLRSLEFEKLLAYHPKVQIDTDLSEDLMSMNGSPVHLSKVVMNLVSNAAEAMPEGGRIFLQTKSRHTNTAPKENHLDAERDYVVLTVSDNGIGISPKDKARIFEPFYTKKVMGRSGTGLGMTVVWGTVEDHGGHIDVNSQEGIGTTFTLFFPANKRHLTEIENEPECEDFTGLGETILVVDDLLEQRELASKMLEKLGYSVDSVPSGEAAIAYVQHRAPDLLLLDMIMDPGIDGLETYRRILKTNPQQKAIIASGYSENLRVVQAQRLGAGTYLKKPYTLEKLSRAVKSELRKVAFHKLPA